APRPGDREAAGNRPGARRRRRKPASGGGDHSRRAPHSQEPDGQDGGRSAISGVAFMQNRPAGGRQGGARKQTGERRGQH
ncbi:hypothetical protein, partial [Propylenella binzhouense]|uniref:hypothetical protein n=1 Tax=Propylenella binzhouense TaxID=2555902 RepID=UPI003CCDA300